MNPALILQAVHAYTARIERELTDVEAAAVAETEACRQRNIMRHVFMLLNSAISEARFIERDGVRENIRRSLLAAKTELEGI